MAKKPINATITYKEDCESSLETTSYFEICTFYSTEKKKQKHSIEGWLYSMYNMINFDMPKWRFVSL